MSKPKTDDLDATKRLIGALLRMPPKAHSEIKVGKSKGKEARSPEKNLLTPLPPSQKALSCRDVFDSASYVAVCCAGWLVITHDGSRVWLSVVHVSSAVL
jgi:hypothetical protein